MRKAWKWVAWALLFAGIFVMGYPHVKQWIYDKNARSIADDFDQMRQDLLSQAGQASGEAGAFPGEGKEGAGGAGNDAPYLTELYEAMQAYNRDLYENGQSGFKDAWSYQLPSFDLTEWGLKSNMAGYIEIPRMEVKLPLYLGASAENMKKGAVHLSYTSLPVGGPDTNCVIAAHRGYAGAAMFREIEALKPGDEVIVANLWETLTYRVTESKIIAPEDTQAVLIQEGKDMVTLMSCHPYRVNHLRYVVYCERVEGESSPGI